MRRFIGLTLFFLAFVIVISNFVPCAFAQQKKKPKEVVISTVAIKEDYEILGIVSVRSGEVDLARVNEKLKEEARKLGAEYVLNVGYFQYSGYIYAYGTAVKIKVKEKEEEKSETLR